MYRRADERTGERFRWSREPEGNIKEREGLVLVLLDGAYETDIFETMMEMNSRLNRERKDVCLGVHSKT